MPAKGMTLPFISYGGSSLISLALGMGFLIAVTRKRPRAAVLDRMPPGDRAGRRVAERVRPAAHGPSCSPPAAPAATCFRPRRWPAALAARGIPVELVTDDARARLCGRLPGRARSMPSPSATPTGGSPLAKARRACSRWRAARWRPRRLIGAHRPAPSSSASAATRPCRRCWPAASRSVPDRPARAERRDGPRQPLPRPAAPRAIATGFADARQRHGRRSRAKAIHTGNPVRPAVLAAARTPYPAFGDGMLRLLVTGGSQGARVMSRRRARRRSHAARAACARRLVIVQQARGEDEARVRAAYAALGVAAEVAPFFADLPARIAAAHLVIGRAGASTVSELAVIGRPSILVPFPQRSTRTRPPTPRVLGDAGAALVVRSRRDFTPASARRPSSPRCLADRRRDCLERRRRRRRARSAARRRRAAGRPRHRRSRGPAPRLHGDPTRMKLPRELGPIHFVGIGGIGMSGIAEVLANLGYKVQGSDAAESANVQRLRDKGIAVCDRPRRREPRRRRGGGRLDRDQARQSRTRRRARAAPAGRAPRRDAGRTDAAQDTASPSPARTARRRRPRSSRPCSTPAASTPPSSTAASSTPTAPMPGSARATGWWSRPTRATAPS